MTHRLKTAAVETVKGESFQITLPCVNLTKTNQHKIPRRQESFPLRGSWSVRTCLRGVLIFPWSLLVSSSSLWLPPLLGSWLHHSNLYSIATQSSAYVKSPSAFYKTICSCTEKLYPTTQNNSLLFWSSTTKAFLPIKHRSLSRDYQPVTCIV